MGPLLATKATGMAAFLEFPKVNSKETKKCYCFAMSPKASSPIDRISISSSRVVRTFLGWSGDRVYPMSFRFRSSVPRSTMML